MHLCQLTISSYHFCYCTHPKVMTGNGQLTEVHSQLSNFIRNPYFSRFRQFGIDQFDLSTVAFKVTVYLDKDLIWNQLLGNWFFSCTKTVTAASVLPLKNKLKFRPFENFSNGSAQLCQLAPPAHIHARQTQKITHGPD